MKGIKIDRNAVAKYYACNSVNFTFTSLSFSLVSLSKLHVFNGT